VAYGVSPLVLSGFLRIVTHRQAFNPPNPLEAALAFTKEIRERPNPIEVNPGRRHCDIFTQLHRSAKAKGNLVRDANFAALAIESRREWITTDRDYARFPGLHWRHPLE
jgi:toxin-antitoxin system PIN domain toxin